MRKIINTTLNCFDDTRSNNICTDHSHGPIDKEIAKTIKYYADIVTRYQQNGKKISFENGEKILHIFISIYGIYGIVGLEELKNEICDERDTYDLVDLTKQLDPFHSLKLKIFIVSPFVLKHPKSTLRNTSYGIKVISDVDNTAIEASFVAPVSYLDKEIIPGFLPIIEALSGYGATTTTFISARPHVMELESIGMMSNKIKNHAKRGGINMRFSFETGTLSSIASLISAEIVGNTCSSLKRKNLLKVYTKIAKIKMENYLKLSELYPDCRFVFFGDDTQGDVIFAYMLVNKDPNAIGIIRRVSIHPIAECIPHERIIYHTSYYEVANVLITNSRFEIPSNFKNVTKSIQREIETFKINSNPIQTRIDEMHLFKLFSN